MPSERQLFSISENFENLQVSNSAHDAVLLIKNTAADSFINSNRIIFGDSEYERGFYRFASWVESPSTRFSTLLLTAIEKSGIVRNVSRSTGTVLGTVQLNTEMIECYHLTTPGRGVGKVKVRAELLSLQNRSVIAVKEFSSEVPVKSYDAEGAVVAISSALNQIVVEMVPWLNEQL
jgi:ABC-type uncharacterized transport system auxiliary subunit